MMNNFQWVTDTLETKPLIENTQPHLWLRQLTTLARFYQQPAEQEALQQTLTNPDWYRNGAVNNGIAHVFEPNTLERNPDWVDNKRLGSHAQATEAFCQLMSRAAPCPLE